MVRVSCFNHTINLVIKDGIETSTDLSAIMKKVTAITSASHQSLFFAEKLNETFKLSIPKPVITRWNTHFTCFQRISKLDRDKLNNILIECGYSNLCLSVINTEKIIEFVDIMQGFNEASIKNQAQNKPNLSLVTTCVALLHKHLNVYRSTVKHLKKLIDVLLNSLTQRFFGIFMNLNICDKTRINPKYVCILMYILSIINLNFYFKN